MLVCWLIILALFATPGHAATLSWSGGGSSDSWGDSGNWGGAGTPAPGDTLIFGAIATSRYTSSNNVFGRTLNQIRLQGAGGGFILYGQPFTLTNNLSATNTSGVNTISNALTVATVDVTMLVGSGASLKLAGQIAGAVGVTKTGLGTLIYQYASSNPYNGTTRVNAGTLQLNVGGVSAFGGPLVIGDGSGTGNPTVQNLQGSEILDTAPITINYGGTLDLNSYYEQISASLTLSAGTITTGSGTLVLSPNSTITISQTNGNYNSYIFGNLNNGSGTLTFQGNTGNLYVYANVIGSANMVQNDSSVVIWYGANSYSGNYTVNSGSDVYLGNSLALGNITNQMTLNGTAQIYMAGNINITNQSLTVNSISATGVYVYNNSTNSWNSSFTLGSVCGINVLTNCALSLIGPIGGPGGVTKIGPGRLVYAGGSANSYAGLTTVNAGELDLNKSGGGAIAGAGLVIGDGTGTEKVVYQNSSQIFSVFLPVTINSSGVLDLNGNTDYIAPITMTNGTIKTGAGWLGMYGTVSSLGISSISGSIFSYSAPVTYSNSGTLYIPATVTGAYGIVKAGSGHVYLSASNSYAGPTVVQQGLLHAQNNWALGATSSGTVVSNGASLVLDGGIGITNESLTLNGPGPSSAWGSLDVESGVNTWAGPITNNANSTLDAWYPGSELHINGTITGAGGLELFNEGTGGGAIYFEGPGANSYAGLTTVDPGCTLQLNKIAFEGAVPHDLNINGTVRNLRDYQIDNSSTVTIGALGLLDLSGVIATNTILASPVHSSSSSGTFTLGYAFTPSTNLIVTHVRHYFGTKVEIWTDTGTLLASQNVTSVPGTWVETPLSTPIQLTSGIRYRVAAYSAGGNYYWRTDLGGTFPYGTIDQGYEISGDAFPTSSDAVRWWFVDLRYKAVLPSCGDGIGSLNGSGSVNLGANYINSFGTGAHTYNGVISGSGINYVAGDGLTYTFNGNNTYTGQTYLYDGHTCTVNINGSQPQSAVYVGGSATLGGSGTVGAITANGTIAPGSSPGILNCSNVTFSASGTYKVDITGPNAGTDYDQLNVRGTNTLANAVLYPTVNFTKPVALGQQFTIIKNDGTDTNVGIFLGYPEGANYSPAGYNLKISYVGGGGNDVVFTLTSIPATAVSSTVTAGNGSHGIDPNGCNNLNLVITNTSGSAMTGVNATLSTTNRGVLITQPYSPYPNIPASGKGTNLAPFQISTLPGFVCGTTISLQLSVDSSFGSFTMNYALNSGEPASAPARFDVTGNVAIPDPGAMDSTNVVSGVVGPLQKVVASLYITHPFDSDLTNISLVAPDGTTVLLSSANGGSGANYGSGLTPDSSRTTFDDAAATAITSGAAPFVGTYRPQSPLSAFIGNATPNGNWHLHLADGFGGSSGTLRGWSLFLNGTACATGSGACDYCLQSFTNSLTAGDPVQTSRIARNNVVASCGVPKAWPGIFAGSYHYDVYAFTNTFATDACVTALLTASCDVQSGIYLNAFDPVNIATNYLGDSGDSTVPGSGGVGFLGGPQSCSVTVPAGAKFFVTVNEISPGAGCTGYTLQLSGLPCPPPTLNIQPVAPDKARLYWDTSAGGYLLQAVPNLMSNNWSRITNEPVVFSGNYVVTNSIVTPTNRFYRLQKP